MLSSSISTLPFIYSGISVAAAPHRGNVAALPLDQKFPYLLSEKLPGSQLFISRAKSADHILTLPSTYFRNKCCCCTTSWKCCGIASAVILVIVGAIIGGGFLYLHVLKSRLDFCLFCFPPIDGKNRYFSYFTLCFDEKNRLRMRAVLKNLLRDRSQFTSNFSRQIIGGGFLYLHVLKSRLDFLPFLSPSSFLHPKKLLLKAVQTFVSC